MKRILSIAFVLLITAGTAFAQMAPDAAELTRLLNEFLAGASRNDPAIHERFWADDLIYTRSAGRRVNKADVMRDVRSAPAPKPGDAKTIYTAEDIRIQQYGDTAIVAFRLVATTDAGGSKQVANLLNSGTFVKRAGKWQVVNWQSTRMPRSEEESKTDVATAEAAFHQAMLAGDGQKLSALTDDGFIWVRPDGERIGKKELVDSLTSGQLKFSKLENTKIIVSVHGDTAIVRGESTRQRSAVPGRVRADAVPALVFYTLTFTNQIGGWKAVALHTSGQPAAIE
ncbi:MAG TPA: nuclear transport factor 2 family protein [Pyrinomonadaceae bacterium]|nr:nuclear transport factor 2 family protein [Pyrinomonadaceae bacterium]